MYNQNSYKLVHNEETWYAFHFEYLKQNPNLWNWSWNDFFPNLNYWASQNQEMTIFYSDLVILDFMERNYPNQFPTPREKLKAFSEVALANNGKFRNLRREEKLKIARKILERNFYSYESQITQRNQRLAGSQREIYSINKNSEKLFLSIDHENFLFEVHGENGQHLGAINFRGELKQQRDISGRHDIIL